MAKTPSASKLNILQSPAQKMSSMQSPVRNINLQSSFQSEKV